jgi:hypothetical protein
MPGMRKRVLLNGMNAYESQRNSLLRRIYNINEKDFEAVALEVYDFQYKYNLLYRQYCDIINADKTKPQRISAIPVLPISFFKDHAVQTGQWEPQQIFRSSGTTQIATSRHFIRDLGLYHQTADRCFTSLFDNPDQFTWIGLLPSYLERPDASLVNMVQYFMNASRKPGNQFYTTWNEHFKETLHALKQENAPTKMIGVSFALLDLFEKEDIPVWPTLTVIETGGMKGRREEITRAELHSRMRVCHSDLQIISEYGMTEMNSQAYLIDDRFYPGPTLRVLVRDISDPLTDVGYHQRGAINIIDLGNIDSCAFIATDDIGKLYPDNTFDVLGRIDQSEVRGCNLMYS